MSKTSNNQKLIVLREYIKILPKRNKPINVSDELDIYNPNVINTNYKGKNYKFGFKGNKNQNV